MMIVDSREPEEIKVPLQRAGWEVRALPAGDLQFDDAVGEPVLIERKTVKQLLDDMTSGQLQRQARILTEDTRFPILLIEGHWTRDAQGYLDEWHTWEQVWNQLATLQDLGLRLQLTSSLRHTVERAIELAEYYGKEYHASIERHPSGDSRIAVLCLIYGIETAKAKVILEAMPTLAEVAGASVERLMELVGIGPKLARRIWEFWR